MGPVLNGYLTPRIYGEEDDPHLWQAFGAGLVFCIISALMGLISIIIDKISEK